ncbi:MAG: response regulator [Pseudomonadota bacterium]
MEDLLKPNFSKNGPQRHDRPLQGLTILMIEDSRYFSDAVRLMAIRSGARLRRADSITAAHKHVRIYMPDVILADIGLPDGSGVDFVSEIRDRISDIPIIAMSGDAENRQAALDAGAAQFLEKPFFDLAQFQQLVLSVLPNISSSTPFRPTIVGQSVTPDQDTLSDDLEQIKAILFESLEADDDRRAKYCAQFLFSVARVAGNKSLTEDANKLQRELQSEKNWHATCKHIMSQIDLKLSA